MNFDVKPASGGMPASENRNSSMAKASSGARFARPL